MDIDSLKEQLAKVEHSLQSEPENAAFLELKKTLEEALQVAQDDDDDDNSESSSSEEEENDEEEKVENNNNIEETAKDSEKTDIVTETTSSTKGKKRPRDENESMLDESVLVGTSVEVLNEETSVWQGAVLEGRENAQGKVLVRYMHDQSEKRVLPSLVRKISKKKKKKKVIDRTKLQIGLMCKARYSGDGEWYDAIILSVSAMGCKVRFQKYRDEEEVLFEHMELVPQPDNEDSKTKNLKLSEQIAEIPKHLLVLDTDSEKVKERKRKKLRNLKRETAQAKKTLVQEHKKQGWKDFQAKALKKKKKKKGSH